MTGKIIKTVGAVLAAALFLVSFAVADPRIRAAVGDSPTLGPADAPVTLIEFIDFQ